MLQGLQLGKSFGLMMRTSPILAVRLGVTLAFWVAAAIYFTVAYGLAWLLSNIWGGFGFIIAILALGGAGFIWRLVYRYVFYMIKAAHIAVLAELIAHGKLPQNQLAYGKEQVEKRFGDANAMFIVDELVEGVVRTFTNTVYRFASFLPGDTLRDLAKVVNRIVRFATGYVDEAIMARSFWRRDESVWESAEEGIVLYAQVWKPIIKNAVALMFLSYVPFFVVLVVFIAPMGFLLNLISTQLAAWSVLFTIALAFLIKVAVGDAFAMTAIIASYHDETQGMLPNAETVAKLESVSDKFREIKQKAQAEIARHTAPGKSAKEIEADAAMIENDSSHE